MASEVNTISAVVWGHNRVFVAPVLGCPAKCAFCYLGSQSRPTTQPAKIGLSELVSAITAHEQFRDGKHGTVISLGCLSEALAPHSLCATLGFLEQLPRLGNPLQLATRWTLPPVEEQRFFSSFRSLGGVMFHSTTEINKRLLESGTPNWKSRMLFISRAVDAGIPSVLYVKPVIPGYTSRFTDDFISICRDSGIKFAVLGPLYLDARIQENILLKRPSFDPAAAYIQSTFPVGDSTEPPLKPTAEVNAIASKMRAAGLTVFYHSLQAIYTILLKSRLEQCQAKQVGCASSLL
jgi:DNA repair photolyase